MIRYDLFNFLLSTLVITKLDLMHIYMICNHSLLNQKKIRFFCSHLIVVAFLRRKL
jgi:hypothetical protein